MQPSDISHSQSEIASPIQSVGEKLSAELTCRLWSQFIYEETDYEKKWKWPGQVGLSSWHHVDSGPSFLQARAGCCQAIPGSGIASLALCSNALAVGNLQYALAKTGDLGFSLRSKNNGVLSVAAIHALFTANSQHDSLISQSPCEGLTKACKMSSKV